ncbi:MAG: Na+/H+ antiporter NhaA [Hyphomicrobium sp.]
MSGSKHAEVGPPGAKPKLDPAVLSGLVLMAATVLALITANSPLSQTYFETLEAHFTIGIAPLAMTKTLSHWINDGLMAIFFLLVGAEIKREFVKGALSDRRSAVLPIIAAAGGMLVPALIYSYFNWNDPVALRGWAIPAATDIAFVVGVMAILAARVPPALKAFLLALAIIDDLGAILIIALFYTDHLSLLALGLALAGIAALIGMNRIGVWQRWPYLLVGFLVWMCVLKSGVHATLAGVFTALCIPTTPDPSDHDNPLERLEHALAPWVGFGIVPIFAFANAGVSLSGVSPAEILTPIPLGIALGLVAGKTIGVYGASRLAIATGLGGMPVATTKIQLLGAAVLAGIGFTMSLFIGMLAFPDPSLADELRIGVLVGSTISAILGYLILRMATPMRVLQ